MERPVRPRSRWICSVPCNPKLSTRKRSRLTFRRLHLRGSTWNGFTSKGHCYRTYEHKRQLCKRNSNKAPNFTNKCTDPRRRNFPVSISRALELSFPYKKSLRGKSYTWPCLLNGALVPLCAKQSQTRFTSPHLTSVAVFCCPNKFLHVGDLGLNQVA